MSVPGFGDPVLPSTPLPLTDKPPRSGKNGKRGAARKGHGKGAKRKPRAAAAPQRARQTRRGPPALTLNVASAFELLADCKKKDMAAIQGVAALLDPLNKKARARVLEAVKAIVER